MAKYQSQRLVLQSSIPIGLLGFLVSVHGFESLSHAEWLASGHCSIRICQSTLVTITDKHRGTSFHILTRQRWLLCMKNGMRRKCGNTEVGIRKGSARLGAGTAGFVGLAGISRGRRGFAFPNFKFSQTS